MTRKDYEKIAAIIKNHAPNGDNSMFDAGFDMAVTNIANDLAAMMAQDNPRFDRARFLKACGLGD